jgi:hypothetical protein
MNGAPLQRSIVAKGFLFRCSLVAVAAASIVSTPFPIQAEVAYASEEICPGVEYFHRFVKDVPWSIHVLRVERGRGELNFVTTLPSGDLLGLSPTTEQIKLVPPALGEPIGAINGDFFSWRKGAYQGDPAGLQIMNGELISAPHQAEKKGHDSSQGLVAFWLDPKNNPHLEKVVSHFEATLLGGKRIPFRFNETCDEDEAVLYSHVAGFSTRTTNVVEFILERDANARWLPLQVDQNYSARIREVATTNSALNTNTLVLAIGAKLYPKLPKLERGMTLHISTATTRLLKNVTTAIGGGPALVRNGVRTKLQKDPRHPRTAFGWNKTHYFFVVVDGRRVGVSDGMTFSELADEMLWWGCTEAMNLDGGGSAMLWAAGQIRNQPSENRERPCANALVLVKKEKP